jgi:hypothetical protein
MVKDKDKEVQNNSSERCKTTHTSIMNLFLILASCRVRMFNCIHYLMCLGLHRSRQLLLQKTRVSVVTR